MANTYKVEYKYENKSDSDFVCEMTKAMDEHLLTLVSRDLFYTYLYNDLCIFASPDLYQIAFRVPGATRGSILVKRLSEHKFKIMGVRFYEDVCFGEFACYKDSVKNVVDKYIGSTLDFSDVELNNNVI